MIIDNTNKSKLEIPLLFGDSLVAYMPESSNFLNKGIAGLTAYALKFILEERVVQYNPSKAALHIGANDLRFTVMSTPYDIALNVKEIFEELIVDLPETQFYLISPLPCVDDFDNGLGLSAGTVMNDQHDELIQEYLKQLKGMGIEYINLNQYLKNEDGSVKKEYYKDKLHINEEGYHYLLECFEKDSKETKTI